MRRPGLDRLRDQVRNAAFDRVLVTAPDRLARNYVHQMLLMEEFERCGCQIEFLDQPTSRTPHDQLLVQIRGAVAEYERSLIAERMRRGRQQKYRAGLLVPWTRPPYGYRVDPARPRDPAGVLGAIVSPERVIDNRPCVRLGTSMAAIQRARRRSGKPWLRFPPSSRKTNLISSKQN